MRNDRLNRKVKEIEELVKIDLSNGRHITNRIKTKIIKLGRCKDAICQDLMLYKTKG